MVSILRPFAVIAQAIKAFFRADVAPPPDRIVHALTVYGLMAAGFVFSWTLFGILGRLGISRTARFELAAITAYCCYYLGVVPEIVIVWNLPPVAGWFLMIPPLAVLMFVLFWPRRGPEPAPVPVRGRESGPRPGRQSGTWRAGRDRTSSAPS